MTLAPEWLWFEDRANLVLLLEWLTDRGYAPESLIHAVEKPWQYEGQFRVAQAVRDHEFANLSGDCVCRTVDDDVAHCTGTKGCHWHVMWDAENRDLIFCTCSTLEWATR